MYLCKISLDCTHPFKGHLHVNLCSDFKLDSALCSGRSQSNFLKIKKFQNFEYKSSVFATYACTWIVVEALSVVSSYSSLWGLQANTYKLQVKNWKNRLLIINFFPVDKFEKSFFIMDVGI